MLAIVAAWRDLLLVEAGWAIIGKLNTAGILAPVTGVTRALDEFGIAGDVPAVDTTGPVRIVALQNCR